MKQIYTWILLSLLPLILSAKVEVTGRTTEGRVSPMGMDVRNPRFGWQILSDQKNVMQKSYQILVASSLEKLNSGESDVWNSGVVKTYCSQWVAFPQSIPLLPGQPYFLKVQVSTNKGKSEWSHYHLGIMERQHRQPFHEQWQPCDAAWRPAALVL